MSLGRGGRTFAASCCALLLGGCRTEGEQEARREAAQLSRTIEVLREAPNDEKGAPLSDLERAGCTADDRCKLKEVCVETYALHVRALGALGAAREELSGQAAPMTSAAAALVQGAEQDLQRSAELAKTCTELETELRVKYKLERAK